MAPLSEIIMDHFLHPRHTTPLAHPTSDGWGGAADSSRFMHIQIRLDGNTIEDAAFGTYGCAPAIAAGSYLCDWALGRTVAEARQVTADQLNDWLGGLPPARRFCADLAVDALQAALSNRIGHLEIEAPP